MPSRPLSADTNEAIDLAVCAIMAHSVAAATLDPGSRSTGMTRRLEARRHPATPARYLLCGRLASVPRPHEPGAGRLDLRLQL
jgi:hypothetical protein